MDTFINKYLQYLIIERNLSTSTIKAYRTDLLKFKNFLIKQDITDFLSKDINDIVIVTFLKTLNQSNRSKIRVLTTLRGLFRFLINGGYLENSPITLLNKMKVTESIPSVLSNEEIDKMLSTIDANSFIGMRNYAIIELLISSGLRVSELTNLKMKHFFPHRKIIRVKGKGSKERVALIGDNAYNSLSKYLKIARAHLVTPKSDDYIFISYRGEKLDRQFVYELIKEAAIKAQLNKKVSPHTLRHSFASSMLNNGADLRSIQVLLGHEYINTTQIYTHVASKHLTANYANLLVSEKENEYE